MWKQVCIDGAPDGIASSTVRFQLLANGGQGYYHPEHRRQKPELFDDFIMAAAFKLWLIVVQNNFCCVLRQELYGTPRPLALLCLRLRCRV